MFKELNTSTSIATTIKAITYKHNALGNRVAKLVDGISVEKYLWLDKTTLLATYDQNDNLKQRFQYGLSHTPVKFTQNSATYYITSDHLGSPRTITDESGNVISDSNESFEIPFGFAGGLKDSDTKLLRFGYRDYDPQIGRWTARDPIGFAGGDTNLYGYVASDPVNFVDPVGLMGVLGPNRMVSPLGGGLGGPRGAAGKVASCPKSNGARGRESEKRVLKDLNLDKNNSRVQSKEGKSIPDALTNNKSVEIKDCKSVSCTRQIRIQTEAAKAEGRKSVLITGDKTHVSGPAERAFDRIIRRPDLGPQ